MNSYPVEFLSHPQPLMLVGGLLPTGGSAATAAKQLEAQQVTRDRSNSVMGNPSMSPTKDVSNLPLTSPELDSVSDPMTSATASSNDGPQAPASHVPDPFDQLVTDLRTTLLPFGGTPRVWVPESERRNFRVVLVDNQLRLPQRKTNAGGSSGPSDGQKRSPLSPLNASSPLYPDGLIAPVWVRKHTDLVPSVFVLFRRLFESPKRTAAGGSPLANSDQYRRDLEADKQLERESDEALINEISDRRRRLAERGIKLTVVLMASAETLVDSDGLDIRLSSIRRASQLSAKSSLFVLTPVSAEELQDFFRSLQDALWDPAMDYYSTHSKRVRKKRSRIPANGSGTSSPQYPSHGTRSRSSSVVGRPLSNQGWLARYDWKAAWFAEVRGEYDLARRHYEDCWNELARMFSSTTLLPPRTKRWAEAKVLADCVSVKIYKLLMYENAGQRVLVPFFVHLRRFGDLSRGWGIGEETFEFWSWVARQYRILGEMLEIGQTVGFQVPPLPSPQYAAPPPSGTTPPKLEDVNMPVSSMNPLNVLHPPASYFYAAACCTMERKQRFEDALKAERNSGSVALAAAPGFANEKNVNHSALIIDLLTRAFSLLKQNNAEQSTLALYIVFRTAETHVQAGQYEQAIKLFEYIFQAFQQEHWQALSREIRTLAYECAKQTGDIETVLRLSIEKLAAGKRAGDDVDHASLQDHLLLALKTTTSPNSEPIVVTVSEDEPLLHVRVGFRKEKAEAGSPVAFQIAVTAAPGVDISRLSFAQLRIRLGGGLPDITISGGGTARTVDVGTVKSETALGKVQACLQWSPETPTLVINGKVESVVEGTIGVSDVTVCLGEESWIIEVRLPSRRMLEWTSPGGLAYIPSDGLSQKVAFTSQQHALTLDLSHHPVAFVGEALPITVQLASTDDRSLTLKMSVYLHPETESDGTTIRVGDGEEDSFIKDYDLGTITSGEEINRVVTLHAPDASTKILDISVSSESDSGDVSELLKTAVIPVIVPFSCNATVNTKITNKPIGAGSAVVSAVLDVPGPRPVVVESMTVETHSAGVESRGTSFEAAQFPQKWDHTASFAFSAHFLLRPGVQALTSIPVPAVLKVKWHPDVPGATALEESLALPTLSLPTVDSFVSVSASAPAVVTAHKPFPVHYAIANTHPTEQAWLAVHGETAEGFVWAGPRGARVGPVAPLSSQTVEVEGVAVGAAGWQSLPHLSIWHGDGAERREVRVTQQGEHPARAVFVRP